MADLPPYSATGDDTGVGLDRESRPGTPGWVKVFGIIALGLILLLVIGVVTGRAGPGGGHGPGRHAPSRDSGSQTQPSSEGENRGSIGGPVAASAAVRTIAVTARDTMTFEPSRITVAAGETVTFVVTNTGQAVHDFTLGDAAMQQELANARAHGMAHDGANSIRLRPGETKQLTWRFADTGIEYGCHEPGHYQAGMRGQITIS